MIFNFQHQTFLVWDDEHHGNGDFYAQNVNMDHPLSNISTRILSGQPEIVKIFSLTQNYLNSFNPITILTFDLPENSQLALKVYNILGAEMATPVSKQLPTGFYR